MTTLADAREAIYQRFEDEWGTTSEFTFDNEKFTPPVGAPWVRVAIRHNIGAQETLGGAPNRRFIRGGILFIQVFVPENSGTRTADTLAMAARTIFEGVTLSNPTIWLTDAIVRDVGPRDGWHQVNVEAIVNYEESL